MSCHPYLQWWISPCAHLLLKRDQLVCPLLLLLLSTLLTLILSLLPASCITTRFVFCIFCPPVAVQPFFIVSSVFTLLFTALGALQPSSKLNGSRLWPLQKDHICSLPIPHCLFQCCWSSLFSAPLVCTRLQQAHFRPSFVHSISFTGERVTASSDIL